MLYWGYGIVSSTHHSYSTGDSHLLHVRRAWRNMSLPCNCSGIHHWDHHIPRASLKPAGILTRTTAGESCFSLRTWQLVFQAPSPLPLLSGCSWKPHVPSGCIQMRASPRIAQPGPPLPLPWSLFLHNLSMTWLCHLSSVKLVFYHPWNYIHLGNISSYWRGECIREERCYNSGLHWAPPQESTVISLCHVETQR